MEDNKNKSPLTVTVVKSKADQEYDALAAEMTAELNGKVKEIAIGEGLNMLLQSPVAKGLISQGKTFLPMIGKEAAKFFGKDEVRVMIYLDEETGALVIQTMKTANIAQLEWKEEPKAEDFFIIEKKDIDNPEGLIKKFTGKVNINLF